MVCYNNIEDFFISINKDMIKDSEYISGSLSINNNILAIIKSLDCGSLNIAPLGYGITKMSFLFNSYVDRKSLDAFIEDQRVTDKNSICFDFKGQQGCIKSLVLTRNKKAEPFTQAKVFFRTVDLSKKIVPDLFLIRYILSLCDNYKHHSLTLFMAQGFIMPANIANTYNVILGLDKKDFNKSNKFHNAVLSYIKISEEYKPTDKRTMGAFLKLLQYKHKELSGEYIPPVTYTECKAKLDNILRRRK